jgi:RHS repeat-associated protein
VDAWGQNGEGQLGNGTTVSSTTPVAVSNLGGVQQAPLQAGYTYNGDDLRMSKTIAGSTNQFAWDIVDGLPTVISDGATSNIFGPGSAPVEQVSATGTVQYLHIDQLGSVRLITDGSGNVQGTSSYDPYGNVASLTGLTRTTFGFAGEYADAETGFSYLRARYHDPVTAQFITRDWNIDAIHPYLYASGNPLNVTDPGGLYDCGILVLNCLHWGNLVNPAAGERQFHENAVAYGPALSGVQAVASFIPGADVVVGLPLAAVTTLQDIDQLAHHDQGVDGLDIVFDLGGFAPGVKELQYARRAARLARALNAGRKAGKILGPLERWNKGLQFLANEGQKFWGRLTNIWGAIGNGYKAGKKGYGLLGNPARASVDGQGQSGAGGFGGASGAGPGCH